MSHKMASKDAERYVEYLQNHLLGVKLCMLLARKNFLQLNAVLAAQELSLTVQTTSNGLHELEDAGILKSEKTGLTRFYLPTDKQTLDEALAIIRRSDFKAPRLGIISMDILHSNFSEALYATAKTNKASVERNKKFEKTPLGELIVDYVVRMDESSHVLELERGLDLDKLLGRAYWLATLHEQRLVSTVVIIAFLETGQVHPGVLKLQKYLRQDVGEWMTFMYEPGDDYTITRPEYASNLVDKIWPLLSSKGS